MDFVALFVFVKVDTEYHRAVESVGGYCLFHFVVKDSAKALEAVARLKQQQQEQKGSLLQRKCCVSVIPIKDVAEQQQRQNSRRHQQLQQRLLEEGVAMPLTEVRIC